MMNKLILGNHSRLFLSMFLIGMLVWMLVPAQEARAATITVTTASDVVDAGSCGSITLGSLPGTDGLISLREAICAANNNAGADIITFDSSLDGNNIVLTISAAFNEHANVSGDLDITQDLTITGNGVTNTVIDASALSPRERVFDVRGGSGTVVFNDLTITGGQSPGIDFTNENTWGGGILNRANLSLNEVRITGNTAGTRGGGIYFRLGTSEINNSLIDNNVSGTSGGGIFSDGDEFVVSSIVTLSNTTISGNDAGGSGGGIAVYQAAGSATATLAHVTVTDNVANLNNDGSSGGGISNITSLGSVNLGSSIVSGNVVSFSGGGTNCTGTITTQDYNVTGTSCGLSGTNDTVANPLLGSLADNGGPTLTHAIATNSPAIDRATGAGCGSAPFNVDQRGYTRPIDGDGDTTLECDSGAYESLQVCSVTDNTSYSLGNVTFFVPTGQAGNIACFQVSEIAKNHPNATTNLETGMYWLLEAQDSSGAAATGFSINLTIGDAGLTFTPDADDKLCRWNGSLWDCDASGFTISPDTLTRNGVTALSPWAAGNNVGPTAITLETLTARAASTPLAILALALLTLALLFFISRKRDMARS